MDLKKQWREIKGYEGKYIISNYGEVISLPRYKQNNSKLQYVEPKEIIRYVNKRNGYVYVQLWNNATYRSIRLHKLVAQTFIPNKDNKLQINHKDGNKQNNKMDNLEWCTNKENIIHAHKMGLANNNNQKIKVNQYDLKGNFIRSFNSILDASKETRVSMGNISLCINNKRKTAGGYIWKYANK